MANYLNLLAGLLGFIGGSSLVYGLWSPVMDFLAYFPTPLYIFLGTSWVVLCFVVCTYFPFILFVSDDRGG